MALVVFPANRQDLIDEIYCTPHVEGGSGSVYVGAPLVSLDGRVAMSHGWSAVDLDWMEAYTQGAGVEVRADNTLPTDWQFPLIT